jgi:hypothetical protein
MTSNARYPNETELLDLVRSVDPATGSPPPAAEQADQLFQQVVSAPRKPLREPWNRLTNRPLAVAMIAAAAAVVVSSAFGAVALVRLLNGQPAPPAVTQELQGNAASGEVQLTASTGDVATVYAAQMNGRNCAYLRLVPASDGGEFRGAGHRGTAVCEAPANRSQPFQLATVDSTRAGNNWLNFVYGQVSSQVASLSIDGSGLPEAQIPLSDGYFLYEVPAAENGSVVTLIARDATGNQLDHYQLPAIVTRP